MANGCDGSQIGQAQGEESAQVPGAGKRAKGRGRAAKGDLPFHGANGEHVRRVQRGQGQHVGKKAGESSGSGQGKDLQLAAKASD